MKRTKYDLNDAMQRISEFERTLKALKNELKEKIL